MDTKYHRLCPVCSKDLYYKRCKKLKETVLGLNIPFMKRKWDIINLNYFGNKK